MNTILIFSETSGGGATLWTVCQTVNKTVVTIPDGVFGLQCLRSIVLESIDKPFTS
jgi:hypothetical protein